MKIFGYAYRIIGHYNRFNDKDEVFDVMMGGVSVHRGACGACVRVAKWFPVLFITAIVVWSYYAFVVHLCVLTVASVDGYLVMLVLLVPYHLIFVLFVASYWKTVFSRYCN